jgi:hypothetical protein
MVEREMEYKKLSEEFSRVNSRVKATNCDHLEKIAKLGILFPS